MATALVSMPEAAVHEDHGMVLWKDQIRLAGKVPVDPVTQAHAVQVATYNQFRFGVFPSNAGHHPAARCRIDDVCHL